MGNILQKRDCNIGGPLRPRPRTGVADPVVHPTTEIEPAAPTLQDVLRAIAASWIALEVKIDTLSIDLGILQDDHKRLAERDTTMERDVVDVVPALAIANTRLNTIDNRHKFGRRQCVPLPWGRGVGMKVVWLWFNPCRVA
ncbi:hypothetical protein NDU88_000347 [Pleurodeles waltl]|uniref:Uncharacterized protein n=1 Tax=Pleurodeles waltl TaxID=8319 RepID=A0AAV7UPR4_PLEWA|nr:hypothetical protein NDU88_000347 [Pleurodeles waltl]